MITAGMAETTEKNMGQPESGVLSIPNTMLAAGIPPDSDLTVEAIPGVHLIGRSEPLRTTNQPLLNLYATVGIETEEAMAAIEEGGYRDE